MSFVYYTDWLILEIVQLNLCWFFNFFLLKIKRWAFLNNGLILLFIVRFKLFWWYLNFINRFFLTRAWDLINRTNFKTFSLIWFKSLKPFLLNLPLIKFLISSQRTLIPFKEYLRSIITFIINILYEGHFFPEITVRRFRRYYSLVSSLLLGNFGSLRAKIVLCYRFFLKLVSCFLVFTRVGMFFKHWAFSHVYQLRHLF